MSKIGEANLDLQEQAEELGFESVQEALDKGYRAVLRKDGSMQLIIDYGEHLQKAHEAWLIKKETVINELEMLLQDVNTDVYRQIIKDAIKFIEEGEV